MPISHGQDPSIADLPFPLFQNDYPRLMWSEKKKLEEEKEVKEYMEAGKDNYFDPSEIQAELGAKVIRDIFCKLRAGDVANKLHVPVYKKPEAG